MAREPDDVPSSPKADWNATRLFRASPTPFLVLAPDAPHFTITEVNDAYLAATMRTRKNLIGLSLFDAFPDNPADLDADGVSNLRASLERVLSTRRADAMPTQKYDIAHPDGGFEERWWSPVNSAILDDHGAVDALLHHATDVTAERRAAAALGRSEARAREVLDGMSEGFVLLDRKFRILEINAEGARLEGCTREEIVGRSHSEVWPGLVNSELGRRLKYTMADRTLVNLEHRHVWPDGRDCWFDVQVDPTNDGLAVFYRDISERKQAEKELRRLNETLEQRVIERTAERDRMWDTSPDLMLAIDFDGVFRRVNPAWTTLLGYAPEDLVGHHVNEFVIADDHRITIEAYELAANGGQLAIENRYHHADGSIRSISWVAAPAGNMTYATGRDVTIDRAREAALEAVQEQLRQSQKMEAMGSLTGGVAHDFNNLLTPIVGALDMLQRKGLGGEREQRLIAGAVHSADRAKTLVQRLLAFARRQPLQATGVDLAPLVCGMADLVSSTTGPQIKVVVDAAENLPPAKADPNQLEMAILNLAVNARDAMPEGGTLRISVDAETVGRQHRANLIPGRYLLLSVADTGSGMDEATMKRAVEPFFSTKGVGKGTGLGLSMAHGLASQLGGALTIRSAPGIGTNVELWLPQSAEPFMATEAAADTPPVAKSRGTALLVDDEDFVRLSTADMLIEFGYKVIETASAEEALKLVDRGLQPDLLVTDHLMPGMSGTELAQTLQVNRPNIKVLIVSGYAEVEGIAPNLPRLTKPFRSAELAASLAALS